MCLLVKLHITETMQYKFRYYLQHHHYVNVLFKVKRKKNKTYKLTKQSLKTLVAK